MEIYLLTAPRRLDMIPEDYKMQMITESTGGPRITHFRKALIQAGITDANSLGCGVSTN